MDQKTVYNVPLPHNPSFTGDDQEGIDPKQRFFIVAHTNRTPSPETSASVLPASVKRFPSLSTSRKVAAVTSFVAIMVVLVSGSMAALFQLGELRGGSPPTTRIEPNSTPGAVGTTLSPRSRTPPPAGSGVTPTPLLLPRIEMLTDGFDSTSGLDTVTWWVDPTSNGTVIARGGQLLASPAKNSRHSLAAIDTNGRYNALGQAAFLEVLQVASGTVDTAFALQVPGGQNAFQILYHSGYLEVGIYKQEEPLYTIPYDASTQKWWRIRESGGTTYADISPDGVTWKQLYEHTDFFDMSEVKVSIDAFEWTADPTAGGATFAHFNQVYS